MPSYAATHQKLQTKKADRVLNNAYQIPEKVCRASNSWLRDPLALVIGVSSQPAA